MLHNVKFEPSRLYDAAAVDEVTRGTYGYLLDDVNDFKAHPEYYEHQGVMINRDYRNYPYFDGIYNYSYFYATDEEIENFKE